jgi:L-amino acid N-acyltransferase YncA
MKIRKATNNDVDSVWEIFHAVIKKGDTYVFDPETPKQDLNKHWFAQNMFTYVLENNNIIYGTYILKPNQIDLGSHVANGSYMVHPNTRRQGFGDSMCNHSIKEARKLGFKAIQFNMIVSTNKPAIELWKKLGFEIVGTIPDGFNHLTKGYIDVYIMYKKLYKR